MNEIALDKFISALTELAPKLSQGFDLSKGWRGFVLHDGISFSLANHFNEYAELLRKFEKLVGDARRFSEQFIEKQFRDLLVKAIKGIQKEQLLETLQTVKDELINYSVSHTLYIPVEGIVVHKDEPLGEVIFKSVTSEFLENISQASKDSGSNPLGLIKRDIIAGMVVAEYSTVAEPQRALERGVEETLRALEIVRFSIECLCGLGNRISVGLGGEVIRGTQSHLILANGRIATLGSKAIGTLEPFDFAFLTDPVRASLGLNVFSNLLKKPSLNSYEAMLLRCLHWFSSAQTQKEIENKFLNLTTVLEVAFTKGNGGSITNTIAENTALFLHAKLDDRKAMKKQLRELYGLRSAVSHGGSTAVSLADAFQLERIAAWLIIELVKKASVLDSHDKLFEHIENIKLS